MKAQSVWQKDQQYDAISESGHHVLLDADAAHTAGPSPMEMVLASLCACTSVDVISILRKKREPVASLLVSATTERAATPPQVFTAIHLTYRVGGKVSAKAVEDAVHLSKTKYCSVSAMLEKTARVTYSIEYATAPETE